MVVDLQTRQARIPKYEVVCKGVWTDMNLSNNQKREQIKKKELLNLQLSIDPWIEHDSFDKTELSLNPQLLL